ncbi:MAG: prolyl oligopeptidase family serine peptidase, partial [Thermoanaerobaculia bacterium]|nr:prolyl oligopeptidase family serine peptidase [Thermoanaerobaculia bacterium]
MTRGFLAGALLLTAPLAPAAEPIRRPSKEYTIEQFLATTAISGASFSADAKKLLFSSNATGIVNVYAVPTAGGAPSALTKSGSNTTVAVSYFPADDRFLYTRDQGGNELNHLYVQTLSGEEKDLTPGEKLKAIFARWTRDGSAFYVGSNERDPRFFDLYRYDTKTYARTMAYQDDTGYDFGAISDDGKWLAFQKINTTADSDIYLWNAAAKAMTPISKHEGIASYEPAAFDPDSKWLYYLTNDGSEFDRVRRYELSTGRSQDVEKADWDIAWTFFSRNGKYRLSAVNQDGRSVLKIYDGRTGAPVALPPFPSGEISAVRVSRDEAKLAFQLDGDRGPNNLYVYDFDGKAPVRLTDTMSKDIDPEDLVEAQVVRFKSFDGMEVPNIFYKPWQAGPQAKVPALVWVHGGPGGQTRRQYSASIQYLVNHGYAILGINNRGSSGYGKSFYTADDHKHGREPLWDCIEGMKYLQGLPYVDPNKVGIIGGSYGGYMVLAALAF